MTRVKQKRVRCPHLIEGLPVDEVIARNTNPIWLHPSEMWEHVTTDEADYPRRTVGCAIE
jgi:hypothetical protein